jgi:hypothetical protein
MKRPVFILSLQKRSTTDMEFITDESRAGSLFFITLRKIRINMYLKLAMQGKLNCETA